MTNKEMPSFRYFRNWIDLQRELIQVAAADQEFTIKPTPGDKVYLGTMRYKGDETKFSVYSEPGILSASIYKDGEKLLEPLVAALSQILGQEPFCIYEQDSSMSVEWANEKRWARGGELANGYRVTNLRTWSDR